MAKINFSDVGEVDLDELECYENLIRSSVKASFSGETDAIPVQKDKIKLHFKNGDSKETEDLRSIMELDSSYVLECGHTSSIKTD